MIRHQLILTLLGSFQLIPFVVRAAPQRSTRGQYFVYIGTYTKHGSKGIYVYRFDAKTGNLASLGLAAETVNPSFIAASPNGKYLYAINETGHFDGEPTGAVSAFAISQGTGKLKFLNQVSSRGAGPAHVSVDKTGRYVLVANYSAGNVAVFRVESDGSLGPSTGFAQHHGSSVNPKRQSKPYAHSIEVSPDNRFAISADLGTDKLLVYRFNQGSLSPANPPWATVKPGSGPRHFVFSPNGKFVYVISEMGSTLTTFSYNAQNGSMREIHVVSTLPPDFKGESTGAEVQILPSGRFLYASNRGSDTIAVFAVGAATGELKPVEYAPVEGKVPRMFAIGPSGKYLVVANQNSANVVVFRINPRSGRLTTTGQQLKLDSPVCVAFVAAGREGD
ncbi:MAG: lactonase family protein [Terriglobia bacterium]